MIGKDWSWRLAASAIGEQKKERSQYQGSFSLWQEEGYHGKAPLFSPAPNLNITGTAGPKLCWKISLWGENVLESVCIKVMPCSPKWVDHATRSARYISPLRHERSISSPSVSSSSSPALSRPPVSSTSPPVSLALIDPFESFPSSSPTLSEKIEPTTFAAGSNITGSRAAMVSWTTFP